MNWRFDIIFYINLYINVYINVDTNPTSVQQATAMAEAFIKQAKGWHLLVDKSKKSSWSKCHPRCQHHKMSKMELQYATQHDSLYERAENHKKMLKQISSTTTNDHAVCRYCTVAHHSQQSKMSSIVPKSMSRLILHFVAHIGERYFAEAMLLSLSPHYLILKV